MSEDNNKELWAKEFEQTFSEIKRTGGFDISPCRNITNIEDNPKYKKLEMSSGQKMQMSAMINNFPKIVNASNAINTAIDASKVDLYVMTLPKGLSGNLMQYKDGRGFGSILFGDEGKFFTHVGMQKIDISPKLTAQAVAMGAFTAMSVVTSQYFLAQINSELDRIKLGMDKILEFLYGNKKAELMAEIMFTKYALNNYSAIMNIEAQKTATIAGLQQSKKVAMKDCEFYISDLEMTVNEKQDIESIVNKSVQIEESLMLALQLCVLSTILEVNYAQNFDAEYLRYIEDDISLYIDKTEKHVIGLFNRLQVMILNVNNVIWKKVNKEELQNKIVAVLDKFKNGGESELTKSLRSGLHFSDQPAQYYISSYGDVYIKTA